MKFDIENLKAWVKAGPPSTFTILWPDLDKLSEEAKQYIVSLCADIDRGEAFGLSWTLTNDSRGYVFTKHFPGAPGMKNMPSGTHPSGAAADAGAVTNVYQGGDTDKRVDPTIPAPTRFRPRYRKLLPEEVVLHDEIEAGAEQLEQLFEKIPNAGRYKALALTALEESIMWAIKDLTK